MIGGNEAWSELSSSSTHQTDRGELVRPRARQHSPQRKSFHLYICSPFSFALHALMRGGDSEEGTGVAQREQGALSLFL